jgi:hypothetical protein
MLLSNDSIIIERICKLLIYIMYSSTANYICIHLDIKGKVKNRKEVDVMKSRLAKPNRK